MTFLELMQRILRPKSNTINPRVTFNNPLDPEGSRNVFLHLRTNGIHGGVDINYQDGINPPNVYPVFAPVSGTVLPLAVNNYGAVLIRSDADGTLHRVLHLSNIVVAAEGRVTAGVTEIGRMSNVSPPSEPVAVHVHYEIYLPDADGWQLTDQRIDPEVYWTTGVNPNATSTSTGLTVLVTPVNDIDGNGLIGTATRDGTTASENGSVVKEGESSFLKLAVNTPPTPNLLSFASSSTHPPRTSIFRASVA